MRIWHFFLVPIVFVVGNYRPNRLKLAAVLILAGIYIAKYTTLHHLLLDQRAFLVIAKTGGSVGFLTEGTPVDDQTRNFPLGIEVEVLAVPDEGFRFDRWAGDCIGADPSCVVKMDHDRQSEAYFIQTAKIKLD